MAKRLVIEVKMSYATNHVSDETWEMVDYKHIALCWLEDTINDLINEDHEQEEIPVDFGDGIDTGLITIRWENYDDQTHST